MNKNAGVWLVVVFLFLAVGIVYALSTSTPPMAADRTAMVSEAPAPDRHADTQAKPQEVALSPDLTKVNPFAFLDPVPVGHKAPDFKAKTAQGKQIRLSDFAGKKNLVLIFYQGSFCSVCAAQLSNIQSHLADFRKQDAEIIAISADDQAHARMSVGEHGLTFNVVPDAAKQIIKNFGVANITKHGIAWPSLFIIDKAGKVRLSYASPEGHRMHSNEILPELSKITGKPAPKLTYEN